MSSVEQRVLHKLALARAYVLARAPYYAETLLNLSPVVLDNPSPHATIGVTKRLVLYVNARWFLDDPEMQTDEQVGAVLVHECEHPLRGLDRMQILPNQDLANIAADLAINCNLKSEEWKLPSYVYYPDKFGLPDGKTLEWYYDTLQKACSDTQKSVDDLVKSYLGDDWVPNVASGACGSVGGRTRPGVVEEDLDKEYGKSEAEVEAIRKQTLTDIKEHIRQYGMGNVPGRFSELIKTIITVPYVDWRAKLRHIYRTTTAAVQAGGRSYSISRPSLLSTFTKTVLAGLIDRPLEIAVVEDTSLSMGTHQLAQAHNETFHIIRKSGVSRIWLLQVDILVHRCERVKATDVQRMDFRGRGGTSFFLAFEKVQKLRPRPNVVIYITDGDGYAPPHPPTGMSVIWCIVKTPHARKPADWGHIVVCDPNQALAPVVHPPPVSP